MTYRLFPILQIFVQYDKPWCVTVLLEYTTLKILEGNNQTPPTQKRIEKSIFKKNDLINGNNNL